MFQRQDRDSSDNELFTRIRKGDENAFTAIYERYNKMIYSLAYRYLMNQELAKDTVQHIFVKLWEHRTELSIDVNVRNFLFTMTKNHVLNIIRNENTALGKQYEIAQQSSGYEDDLVEKLEQREQMAYFYQAVDQLPPQKKEICLMKFCHGMSNQEIADRLHLSINTVKSHYTQALKHLRKELLRLLTFIL